MSESCKSELFGTFTTITGTVFTATMSATGTGNDCESAKQSSEYNLQKTLEVFLLNYTPKIVSKVCTVLTLCNCVQTSIPNDQLYYRVDISPQNDLRNDSYVDYVINPDVLGNYSGVSNCFMTQSDYVTYNTNIINFISNRVVQNTTLPQNIQVPDLYNEVVNISILPYENNYIQAAANYVDLGSGIITTIPFVDYSVTTASGIFEGYKTIRILFYNNGNPPGYTGLGPVRLVQLIR